MVGDRAAVAGLKRKHGRRNARRVLRLYRAGMDVPAIARHLKLDSNTVLRHLRRMGVPRVLAARRSVVPSLLPRQPYWELRTYRGTAEIVCGRKFCSVCGRWRLLMDFAISDGDRFMARCRTCALRCSRYYTAHLTPEQVARRREYDRIWKEGQRRAAGLPPRVKRRAGHRTNGVINNREGIYFPVAPLKAELDRLGDGDLGVLAARAGIPEHTIWRIRNQSDKVQIDVADKLAVALGTTSALLFGEAWDE